ncbi:PAS domain-containing protein [Caenimonas terrae]|uniref:histidine kinase n=1 Tax=Caenimonas terrae TaxID=696074 RepID=A0ABW0NKS3_9BURK
MSSLPSILLQQVAVDTVFHSLPDPAFRLDAQGLVLDANDAAAAALATQRSALVGRRIHELGLSVGPDPFAGALQQLACEGTAVAVEFPGGGPGHTTHHEARLVQLPAGEILALVRDTTERKLVENALRDSDSKFRHLADNITDVFWIRSPDMRDVHYVSPGFERIWGLPMDHHYGSPEKWTGYIVPEDRERVAKLFAGLAGERRSLDTEYRITRPDGELRWIRVRGFQVRDAQDRLIRNTGIVTDITEQRRAQAALDAAQRDLREASRQAGMAEIATNVLHNVGNILNSVTVSADLLRNTLHQSRAQGLARAVDLINDNAAQLDRFLALDERGRLLPEYLGAVSQALVRERQGMLQELDNLTRSIDHIREVVSMQQTHAGRPPMLETAAIGDLVEDALRINSEALSQDEVVVVREFEPVPDACLDRGRVLQVLVNLIGNARDALLALPQSSRRLTVRIALPGGRLCVSVQDNGEGIPAGNLMRIFSHGFTTRERGHGFGLHSCALAAAQMKGTLTAASDGPGLGATFTLDLPFDPAGSPP